MNINQHGPEKTKDAGGNWTRLSICLAWALLVAVCVQSASAQYFGRNKVQYQDYEFSVLHTPHFEIYYYPAESTAVGYAARMSERWFARHSAILDDTLHGTQPMILYASFPQFEETNVVQGIGVGTGGVTEPVLRRVVLPFAGPLRETDHVLGHELVHAFQFDITGHGRIGPSASPSAERLPLWFIEGMAEYLSLGPKDPNTAMWMRDALQKELPDIGDLESGRYFPYRYGQALIAYIGGRWGDAKLGDLLRASGRTGNIRVAIDSVLGIKPDSLSRAWHAAIHASYDTLLSRTSKPAAYGPALVTGSRQGGDFNVSPVISPDGRQMVFFSTRDQFSIDLYLADAKTGKVIRDIYKTALDSHLQNLEFINSAGAWDPESRRFVFSAVRNGKPILEILNIKEDEIEQEIPLENLAQVFDPAWSPDGRFIAFSAIHGGLSDLYLYDLQTDTLRQLTRDAWADFQPAWSPDGKRLAFTTDRFTGNLLELEFPSYTLATMEVESGRIEPLGGCKGANNINPQWTSDGQGVFFVSDNEGIPNIYRLDFASDSISQLTNLYTGVSGITAISPALSVARDTTRLVSSVYENGTYNIYAIDSAGVFTGHMPSPPLAGTDPGFLPPSSRKSATFMADLLNPRIGLPSDTARFASTEYHPSFHLVGISQPSLVGGVNPFGTYVGGGAALYWSDMLGDHNLATALSVQSGNRNTDIAGLLGYSNSAHRLAWGAVAQQVPFIYGGYAAGYDYINGIPAYIEQDYIYREIDRNVSGIISYPFSQVLRTELSAGYENITFRGEIDTRASSLLDGSVLVDEAQQLPYIPAINLGRISAAIVYDNSVFGATGPVLGSRYRFEVSPTIGTLSLYDILGDYRLYLMPARPFTLAGRVLLYGRYGRDADDGRLSPMYLGYPGLIRGYSGGFLSSDQVAINLSGSTLLDNPMYGSKLLVGNFELRFPLFGVLGLGSGYYGILPIELATFFDSGVAWSNSIKPKFLGGSRDWLTSVGEALRMNFFGYAVIEVDFVRPLNQSILYQGWVWVFNLTEGF